MAVTPANNNNGFFGGDGWWAIIIFAMIFGWGGFGGNGFGGNGVQDGYILASDFSNIERKIDGVNNGLCDGFYAMNSSLLNGFSNVQQAISTNGYETRNAIQADTIANMQNANALQSQLANCCCENREAIANLNYNLATQSCETKQAIADSTKSILDFLTQDKIATLTAENQSLKLTASQVAQNNYLTNAMSAQTAQLINAINPCPVPAYVVPNPNAVYNACGCGC